MKLQNALVLNEWVEENRDKLTAPGRSALSVLAVEAAGSLGFKVNAMNLAAAMKHNGMATKRPAKSDVERLSLLADNLRLGAENEQLKLKLRKVLKCTWIDDDTKEFIFANITDDLRRELEA